MSNQAFFFFILFFLFIFVIKLTWPKTVTHLGALGAPVNTLPKVVGILEKGIVPTAGLSLYSGSFRVITPHRPFPPDRENIQIIRSSLAQRFPSFDENKIGQKANTLLTKTCN